MQSVFIACQAGRYWNILKLCSRPLVFTNHLALFKLFLKRGLELAFLPCFLYNFWRKIFLFLYCINWTNFSVYFMRYWTIWLLQLSVNHVVMSWILKFILSDRRCLSSCQIDVVSSRFFYMTKSRDNNLKTLRTNRAFKMKQKVFFIIFKGFLLKQITQFFLEGESPTIIVSL